MTPNDGNWLSKSIYNGPDYVRVGNGSLLPIKHVGVRYVSTVDKPIVLRNVLRVPHLKHNLLPVK